MKRFTVYRNSDAWLKLGPFGGWHWQPTDSSRVVIREYLTKPGAWLAGWWATRGTKPRQEA